MSKAIEEEIVGKVLIFTDQHFGLKGNSELKAKIAIKAFKEVLQHVKDNKIKYVISCGDIFHSRTSIDVNILNIAYKCMTALAKHCKVFLICGNHDAYLKNSTDINSINMFQDIENVVLVNEVTSLCINKKKALLVPWLGDLSTQEKESYDYLFGHFDVSSKYLIRSYIEEHSKSSISSELTTSLDADEDLKTGGSKASDLIGDFVEVAKRDGIVFAGHIHTRKEFIAKGRKFIFVGSPYQQNLGEKDNLCGFYILDAAGKAEFHEVASAPKHVEFRMSQVLKDLDGFDFSIAKDNIVHKVYDVEVDPQVDAKIS